MLFCMPNFFFWGKIFKQVLKITIAFIITLFVQFSPPHTHTYSLYIF